MITDIGAVLSKEDCLIMAWFYRKYIRCSRSRTYMITPAIEDAKLFVSADRILEQFTDMVRVEEREE